VATWAGCCTECFKLGKRGARRDEDLGLFEPALPLGVDKLPAVLDEFAPSVPLSERDGKLGLKLVVNRLVVTDNGVDVLVRPASGVGERMDRGGHPAGHRPVAPVAKLRILRGSSAVSFQSSYSSSLVAPDLTLSTFWLRQMPAALMSIGLRPSYREPTATPAALKSLAAYHLNERIKRGCRMLREARASTCFSRRK